MKLRQGAVIAGRYEIIERLGVGGMANVYRARDLKLERDVTFKVMREEFITDDEFKARFSIEARAAASLSDQNIVNVYDVGQDGHIHYIVMEYIDGVTLKDLIIRRAPFEDDEILGVAIQIAHALEHAHGNGIIHRDIKPQNILVTSHGMIKVTDFGIARAATSTTITAAGNTMGSVHYFSPEQARGGYVDDKSDIYALGIVMYEMATGRLPFEGDTAISVALKHINEPPEDISNFNPNTSEIVKQIIKKSTEKHTSERYSSITDMCNELKRTLTNYSGTEKPSGSKASEVSECNTIRFTPEDIAQIQKESKERNNLYDINGYGVDEPNGFYNESYNGDRSGEYDDGYSYDDNYDYDEGYDDYGEMYDDKIDKTTERKVILGAIGLALSIVLVVVLFMVFFMNKGNDPATAGKDVVDFDLAGLIGMNVDEMDELARDLGIKINWVDEVYSDEFKAGLMVSYEAPDVVRIGDTVDIVTSKGSDKIKVPAAITKDISEAYELFDAAGFLITPQVERVFSEEIPIDVVIDQSIDAGDMVSPDAQITLYVSRGPDAKMVVMPSVLNETEAKAIQTLQDLGLRPAKGASANSTTIPEGRVMRQSIVAGEEVKEGTVVTINISLGHSVSEDPPPVTTSTKPLLVDPYIQPGVDSVHYKIIRVDESGTSVFFDEVVSPTFFPHTFEVSGTGSAEFQVYFIDADGQERLQVRTTVNFD